MPLVERKKFQVHPECLTELKLVAVELDEEGDFGTQIRWSFDSDELMDDKQPFRQTYWTTPTLNEKSNLYRLLKAFGENPDEQRWEVEDVSEFECLLGRRIQANIIQKKKARPDGTVQINARIDTVMPLPRRGRREGTPEGIREPAGVGAGRSGDPAKWKDED